jgi:hypothetical protein
MSLALGTPCLPISSLLGQKLEKLGFIYHRGNILIIESAISEEAK